MADWDGVLGGSGTDNAAAFRRAFLVMAQDGTAVRLGNGKYRLIVNGGDANISNIDSISGASIYSDGAHLYFDGTFTGSQFVEVFSFRDCTGPALIGTLWADQYPLATSGLGANRGIELFKFWDGCTNVRTGPIYATGVRSIVLWRRNSTSDPKGSGGFHEMLNGVDCGYGLANTLSGDNITANIVQVRAVRSYYPYGISNHNINVVSQDHWGNADVNISSASGSGCSGLDVRYENLTSTVADDSIDCVKVSFTDQTPAVHRDMRFRINLVSGTTTYVGRPFVIEKLDNGGSPDATDRGHILDSVEVSGCMNSGTGNQRNIGMFAIGTWGAGEFVRNLKIGPWRGDGGGQANLLLGSVQDVCTVDNFYSSAQVNLTGPINGRANFSAINVNNWSTTGGNCYLLDEKEITVSYSASITFSSFEGSRFVITATNGTAFTINAPTNAATGKRITVTIRNTSGGALGAITWNAVFLKPVFTSPATANSRSIEFQYNGTSWVMINQTAADVPN